MNHIVGETPSSVPAPVRDLLIAPGFGPGNIDGIASLKLIAEATLAVASIASIGAAAFRCKRWSVARPAVVGAVVSLLIFGMITLTPKPDGPHHAIAIYPFPQLIVAYGLSLISVAAPRRWWRQPNPLVDWIASGPATRWGALSVELLGAALIVVVVGGDVGQLLHFERRLVQTGGDQFWSSAIDDSDRVWNDHQIDLSPWQGRQVTLSLVTRPIDGVYRCAWALWGDPTIQSFTLR